MAAPSDLCEDLSDLKSYSLNIHHVEEDIYYNMFTSDSGIDDRKSDSLNTFVTWLKEAGEADQKLEEYLQELQSKRLNKKTKSVLKTGLQLRYDFWILLGETRQFLRVDKDDANEAIVRLKCCQEAMQAEDIYTLNEEFEAIKQISNAQKQQRRATLKQNWLKWIQELLKMRKAAIDIQGKDDNSTRNLHIGLALFCGVAAIICVVATFGVGTIPVCALGVAALPALVSEEVLCVGGAAFFGKGAYELYKSKPLIEKTLNHMSAGLGEKKKIAMKLSDWFQDIMDNGESGKRWMNRLNQLQNEHGELIISDKSKDYIDLLMETFEKWRNVCGKASVAVKNVQMRASK